MSPRHLEWWANAAVGDQCHDPHREPERCAVHFPPAIASFRCKALDGWTTSTAADIQLLSVRELWRLPQDAKDFRSPSWRLQLRGLACNSSRLATDFAAPWDNSYQRSGLHPKQIPVQNGPLHIWLGAICFHLLQHKVPRLRPAEAVPQNCEIWTDWRQYVYPCTLPVSLANLPSSAIQLWSNTALPSSTGPAWSSFLGKAWAWHAGLALSGNAKVGFSFQETTIHTARPCKGQRISHDLSSWGWNADSDWH